MALRIVRFFASCFALLAVSVFFTPTANADVFCEGRKEALNKAHEEYNEVIVWKGVVNKFNPEFVADVVPQEFRWIFAPNSLVEVTADITEDPKSQTWTLFASGPRPGSPLCIFYVGHGGSMRKDGNTEVIEFHSDHAILELHRSENIWILINPLKGFIAKGDFWENTPPEKRMKPNEI